MLTEADQARARSRMNGNTGIVLRAAERLDGWLNRITGFGVHGRDRTISTHFCKDTWLTWAEISDLFHYDALCRRICSIFPQESLRRGWKIEGGPRAAELEQMIRTLQLVEKIQEAAIWGRAFGGSVMVLGIEQNVDPRTELEIDGPTPIRFADVYDLRRVWWDLTYTDPRTPSYAKAQVFRITPMYGTQFWVHRSRCLVFGGALTADQEKEQRAGWDASVLQAPFNELRKFQDAYGSLSHLLSDASTSVFKLKGLLDAVANKTNEDLTTRMQILDAMRSVFRSVMLDADQGEEFTKVPTSFAGVSDVIDQINGLVSSATEIPITKLFGRSPAGMNATGESDTRNWYDVVESYRMLELEPQCNRLLDILAPGQGYKFVFPSLWQPTMKEKAETRKLNADADAVYLDREVYFPEEVAKARTGDDSYNNPIEIDQTIRARFNPTAPSPTVAAAKPASTMK